ncbi:MAG: hypothetical protein RMM98_16885 [Acidobacteriota bacterium]|nr:hypothetical protein [Blastocatellia bacterium]MDW8241278.1 hypothetical protein [Acidobacteriota bacterium]
MSYLFSVLKNILLWSYQRGSWQYELLCILILAFIFLTPSSCFTPPPEPLRHWLEPPATQSNSPTAPASALTQD